MTAYRIGIDVGGTKTEGILLRDDSRQCFRERVATPRDDYDGTLATIAGLVERAERVAGVAGVPVGVGIPGSLSRVTGLVKNANSTWLNGQPLQRDLSNLLQRPVAVSNDANCLAVSEAVDGAGQGCHVVLALILGTGCGSGIAVDGRPLEGPNGLGGEWGHNPLPWTPEAELRRRPCFCGRFGCTETFLSGPGLALSYELAGGRRRSTGEIARLADEGELLATRVLAGYVEELARGLAAVINVVDPDVVVLGGGMSNIPRLYQHLPGLLPELVLGGECATPVVQARHGDSSGVRGAAWLNPLH